MKGMFNFQYFIVMKHSRLYDMLVFVCFLLLSNYGVISEKMNIDKKIIIIGAGPAGIAAASKLFENGFKNVTILEAENRIGGRLYTTKLGNYSIDLGGQWVHGEKKNVAFNLAYPLGLLDTTNESVVQEKLFDSAGNVLSARVDENIENFMDKYFVDGAPDEVSTSAESYGEFVKQAYKKEFENTTYMINHKNEFLHYLEVTTLGADSGDSWNEVSIQDTDGYVVREGGQDVNWKNRGYGTILDILMKRFPDPTKELPVVNNTILNTEATLIDYTEKQRESPIIITTKDNREFEADHVIVTVSLGVLKAQHKSLFNPQLPPEKVNAIEALGFGNAGKVYLLFEKPFWNSTDKNTQFGFIWNDADIKAMENDPEKMWLLGVIEAQSVEHKPNLLEFYVASKWAKAMEKIPENKVYNQTFELLERFLGKTYQIPKPIAMMRTQWYTNPHFRGAYSYRSVESERRHINPKNLQKSITAESPKILFAGEATSPHRFSTADGAIESGWTAADSLINLYKPL